MNPLLEMMINETIAQNEARKDDPIPSGAIAGLEDLIQFVADNQIPTPSDWRTAEIYKMAHGRLAYLRDVQLPQSLATLFVVSVPIRATHAYIRTIYVPAFTALSHDPDKFGISPDFDAKKKAERPLHFEAWERFTKTEWQFSQRFQHIESLGIIPDRRNNDWATFRTMREAEDYLVHIKTNAHPPSATSLRISRMLQEPLADTRF